MTSRKKQRARGSKTHGGGAMKKRRGAGHRGGRGRAGSGKKGDAKKPSYWKEDKKKGFVGRTEDVNVINISKVNETADGLGNKKGDTYEIDLSSNGYGKLLASGTPTSKFNIKVEQASDRAVEKIEKAGGSVTLLKQKKVKKEKPSGKKQKEESQEKE